MGKRKDEIEDAPTRILNAALALIAEKGSDALRTREILERAGVSNLSAISYYFGSLDNLRMRVLDRYFAGARPVLEGFDEAASPREALLGYCRRMARFVLENPTLERNVLFLALSGDPSASIFPRMIDQIITALTGLILRGRGASAPEESSEDYQKARYDAIAFASATIYPLLLAGFGPGTLGIDAADEAARERYFANLVDLVLGAQHE